MSAPLWMPLYWEKYFADTRHLKTATEHGAYLLLIGALWDARGKVSADPATLAKHACCTADEWAALSPIILPFFRVVRGQLTHKKVSRELVVASERLGNAKKAGVASAAKRKALKGGKDGVSSATPVERPLNAGSTGVQQTQHNTTQDSPEDKSSGRRKPSPPAKEAGTGDVVDLDKKAWADAVSVLTGQGGMAESDARKFFGKLVNKLNLRPQSFIPGLARAMVNQTRDPQSYLESVARQLVERRKGQGGGGAPLPLDWC